MAAQNLEKVKEELALLKEKVTNYERQFEEKVQDHPVASVGVAFGAGVLMGALVSFFISRRN